MPPPMPPPKRVSMRGGRKQLPPPLPPPVAVCEALPPLGPRPLKPGEGCQPRLPLPASVRLDVLFPPEPEPERPSERPPLRRSRSKTELLAALPQPPLPPEPEMPMERLKWLPARLPPRVPDGDFELNSLGTHGGSSGQCRPMSRHREGLAGVGKDVGNDE